MWGGGGGGCTPDAYLLLPPMYTVWINASICMMIIHVMHPLTAAATLTVENLLIKVGDQMKSQWYTFGLAIGAPRNFLDQLSGEDQHCLRQVLEYWLKHHPGKPKWEEVSEVQRKVKPLNQLELEGSYTCCITN